MNMHAYEDGPITLSLPQGGFEAVQGVVSGMSNAFRTENGRDSERLSVKQDFTLQQVASEGVLSLLDQMKVGGANSLAAELRAKTSADPYTDMLAVEQAAQHDFDRLDTELEEHQQALAEAGEAEDAVETVSKGEQSDEAAVLQLEEQMVRQQRYIRLAEAVGATARATVAAVSGSNSKAVEASIERARRTVKAVTEPVEVNGMVRLDTAIGSIAAQALTDMLSKLENPPLRALG